MKNKIWGVVLLLGLFISAQANDFRPTDYVDCFLGTSNSRFMLGPYAQRPLGLVQLGPDNQGNVWMGGFEYAINSVNHFSHIHAWTMGGLAIMPTTADLALDNPSTDSPYFGANAGYHSRILKKTERAFPGYYGVHLYDHDVEAEMTATIHCGFQRYTYPECKEARILVNLAIPTEWDYGYSLSDAQITKISETAIEGYADCKGGPWSGWSNWKLFFVIRVNKPMVALNGWDAKNVQKNILQIKGNKKLGAYMTFRTKKGEQILVQSAVSLVSLEGARNNLQKELEPYQWNFQACVDDSRAEWDKLLGTVRVEGSEKDMRKFYTNFYRAFTGSQICQDVDGQYRDACETIRQAPAGKTMIGGEIGWNAFWNLDGLWALTAPSVVDNISATEMEMYKQTGWLSKDNTGISYSGNMEGSHEIAFLVAAYQRGIVKNGEEIYKAVRKIVTQPSVVHPCSGVHVGQPNLNYYVKYGYMPSEIDVVSKTLDYAYDDYGVSQLAKALKKKKDAACFLKRSMNYRNCFNPQTRFVSRRDSSGQWDPNFNVFSGKGFIEGNAWEYTWYVPHDMNGLLNMIGKDTALQRLRDGFEKSRKFRFAAPAFDRTEGQTAEYYVNQGNEVNMQSAFIFNYLHRPDLCQKYAREVLDTYYGDTPYDGWQGDEDNGQMGAWFVMTAMGLFPMDGGVGVDNEFDLSSPLFKKITLNLDSTYYRGSTFTIEAVNNSPKNVYIESAVFNGKILKSSRLPFRSIVNGGRLVLHMTDDPGKACWRN